MPASGNRGLLIALAGIALLLLSTLLVYRTPAARGPDAAADAFSALRAKAILQDLAGSGVPHPIGSPDGVRMRQAIVQRLSSLGYAIELQSGYACNDGMCGSPVNIIAKLGDKTADDSANRDVVLLAAHYDSVPAGPGASDDGVGVATVIEIARILAMRPPAAHPIVLLLTDGEEAGLLGAVLFVREHPLAKRVAAAVNVDARGTSGPSLMFETGTANAWLMRLYAAAVARPITNSLYYAVYKLLPNDTDFSVFKAAGYQGYNFAIIGNVARYHTPLDTVANTVDGSIQHQGDNALAVLSALAGSPALNPPSADAVFFDVFARTLIAWPARFTLPATLLSLALLLAEVRILLLRQAVAGREILWGCLSLLGMLALGAALCTGLLAGLVAAGHVPRIGAAWIAHPLPMQAAAAAIALAAAAVVGGWLRRRAGFWGLWAAAALNMSVLSAICAVVIPGASFPWLLAAVTAGLSALPVTVSLARSRQPARWAIELAAVLPVLAIFAGILPSLQFLYAALGGVAWPVSTLVTGLGFATLMPLLAAASSALRRWVAGTAALTAAAGVLATACLPAYSADWPQRLNLEYWLDADTGQAHFLAVSRHLPASLAAAAHFDPVPHPRFAGSSTLAFYAGAPQQVLGAPELTLAAPPEPVSDVGTRFELHLRSARGAPEALVVFPASAHVADVMLKAPGPMPARLGRLAGGATFLDVVSLPPEGVDFSIVVVAARLPVRVQVFDQSYDFAAWWAMLERARPSTATSSQDGDLTVVHRTVSLGPAAGR